MITEFGKALRIIRVDMDEHLSNMAHKLGFSSSYLSAIEHGKRSVPASLISDITEIYDLSADEWKKLRQAADKSIRTVKIDLSKSSRKDRELAILFAQKVDKLSDEDCDRVAELLR